MFMCRNLKYVRDRFIWHVCACNMNYYRLYARMPHRSFDPIRARATLK